MNGLGLVLKIVAVCNMGLMNDTNFKPLVI